MGIRKLAALVLVMAVVLFPLAAAAQQSAPGAPVTQTGSTGLAAQQCLVVNSGATATAQQTLTVPNPGGGNSIYFDFISASLNTTSAAVTTSGTPLVFTTTNIAGTPSFPVASGVGGGGNLGASGGQAAATGATGPLTIPIKALVGTSPTIVSPTATTSAAPHIAACWHTAP